MITIVVSIDRITVTVTTRVEKARKLLKYPSELGFADKKTETNADWRHLGQVTKLQNCDTSKNKISKSDQ